MENLPSIVRCGLVPGGIDGGNRLALHFGAFAPWDEMNVATKVTLRNVRKGDPIAIIYIPSATLARYGAGVAANGTFMVFDVIRSMRSSPFGLAKATGGNAWSTSTLRERTRNVWRTRSVLVSSTHPKSRLRCSSKTSQRSTRCHWIVVV